MLLFLFSFKFHIYLTYFLINQAVFRYHSATGLRPYLSLCTTEGATLSSHDFIVDVLSNNELVNATVESWQLAPLSQRYREACSMLNKGTSNNSLRFTWKKRYEMNVSQT